MIRNLILTLCFLTCACAPASTLPSANSATDAELESAIKQARDSLGTFVSKLATPHANRTFVAVFIAVKVRFSPPGELPQDIWIDEVTYENGVFRGDIGDDIPALKLEAGETITIPEDDIVDWMIVEEGKLIGGYTIRLAVQRMSPEERERFLETLDYSIED
jgi:uncharacterized protein YegJ (DUF2314 family)